ncbi:MAG: hypothetical protein ACFFDN_00805 [Candidatus Hodarchaeota archaeon]
MNRKNKIKAQVVRNSKGRLAKGSVLNPSGSNGARSLVIKINGLRKKIADYLYEERKGFDRLKEHAESADAKISNSALQFMHSLVLPKMKPVDIINPEDLEPEIQEKLRALTQKPLIEQSQAILNLYITGELPANIAGQMQYIINSAYDIEYKNRQQIEFADKLNHMEELYKLIQEKIGNQTHG